MPSEIVEKLLEAEESAKLRVKPKLHKSDLANLARLLVVRGDWPEILAAERTLWAVNKVLHAAVQRAATASSLADLADDMAYSALSTAFTNSLSDISVFDALKPFMHQAPMRSRLMALTAESSGIPADIVNEMEYAPFRRVELDAEALAPKRAVALVCLTDHAWNYSGAAGFVESEMRAGIARALNNEFLADLATGAESAAGTGNAAAHVIADVAAMLAKIELGSLSRPHLVVAPGHAKRLSTMHASGIRAFPEMTPLGGELCGLPVLVSSELPQDSTGPRAMLIDPDGIVFDDLAIELHIAEHASLRLTNQTGDTGASELISLWQQHLKGIRARRWWAAKVTRPDAVCVLNQTQW